MTGPALEELLEVRPTPVASVSVGRQRRTSKIAKTSLTLGILAGFAGFVSLLCEPPGRSVFFLDGIPDSFAAAILFSVLFSVPALLFAVVGVVRIALSAQSVKGYSLCLGGAALGIVANVIWLIRLSISS